MFTLARLVRVKHWVKNLFLLIPSFFAGTIFRAETFGEELLGVLAFSFVASGIYIINDIKDRENDALHPRKKERPIASGKISVRTAQLIFLFLVPTGLVTAYILNLNFFLILIGYFLLNIAYTLRLKNIPILDLFIVAIGFLLRIYSGGVIAGVLVTNWMAIMVFLLSLFLVIAKRRDDLLIKSSTGSSIRKSSESYNLEFINSCLTLISSITIVAYIMYTLSPEVTEKFESDYLFITTIFVMAGIIRYLQITFVEEGSGSPTQVLYKDKFIITTIILWIISFYSIIYL